MGIETQNNLIVCPYCKEKDSDSHVRVGGGTGWSCKRLTEYEYAQKQTESYNKRDISLDCKCYDKCDCCPCCECYHECECSPEKIEARDNNWRFVGWDGVIKSCSPAWPITYTTAVTNRNKINNGNRDGNTSQ